MLNMEEMFPDRVSATSTHERINQKFFCSVLAKAEVGDDRKVVQWPNISLSYVFSCDPSKQKLQDLLAKYKSMGLSCKYPFRERADPSIAGVLVEGHKTDVAVAYREVDELFQSTAQAMKSVQLVMNEQPQYLHLSANDMGEINYIQGCVGVHIMLDYRSFEPSVHSIESVVDLRFLPLQKAAQEDQEMLSVSVGDPYAGGAIIVSIISTNSSDIGWTWGVNSLLVLLDSDEDSIMRFSAPEKHVLNNGGVLVHTDSSTGKTILQVQPSAMLTGTEVLLR